MVYRQGHNVIMHLSSYLEMQKNVGNYLRNKEGIVVDIGSFDVNGTYKPIISQYPKLKYVGVDIEKGKNVDIVIGQFQFPFADNSIPMVISGQTLEHCTNPFLFVKECARILSKNGIVILIAPWQFGIHRFPIDCWRILPDGMIELFKHANLECLKSYVNDIDCCGVAKK